MKKSISYAISLFVFLQKNKFKNCNMKRSSFFTIFVFVLLFSNAVHAQYCIPASGGGSCITNVTVGTINNTTTGCPSSANNYNTFASPFVFYQGVSNSLSITCSSLANTGAWIDFNHNMILEPTEYFSGFTNALNGTINITAPGGAMTGATLLRIRSSDTSTYIGVTDACNTFLSGETEDYSIIIAASCIGTPDAGITVATSNPICGGMMDTLSLVGATVAPGLSYSWQRANTSNGPWVALGAPSSSSYVCIPPMGVTRCYHCIVTCLNTGAYDTSVAICITSLNAPTSITNVSICSNQLPYTWNGQLLATAGTYSDTLLNAGMNGCDSISILNLSINSPAQISGLIVCQNQLPYLWNGQLLATAGTYTDTLLNAGINGCDSISIVNFSINPVPTHTGGLSVCQNQLPYLWNGQSLITAGTYSTTLLNASIYGCDSISILNFGIHPIPTYSDSLIVCANQLPYLWNGQFYSTAGIYIDTMLNASMYGCDSISTLNFGINPMPNSTTTLTGTTITSNQVSTPSTYQWIDCSNNQPINSATANSFTATTNGSYAVVVSNGFCTDTSACVSVTTVGVDNLKSISNIHVFPNPTSSILYIDVNSATSQNITLKLLDMSGRIANQKKVKVNSGLQHLNMNMAELPKGMYTLEVYENGVRKLIQQVEKK